MDFQKLIKRAGASALIFVFFLNQPVYSNETVLAGNVKPCTCEHSCVNADAPITVMQDHVHAKGSWMLSYRYMNMRMSGNRKGHDDVSNADVLRDFMVTPTDMTMNMHMLGLMIAPSDHLTLAAMLPIVRKDMNHRTRTGLTFRTHSEGIGDLKLAGLIPVLNVAGEHVHHKVHLNAGLSFPIGETDAHGDLPTGPNQRLPYPMQIGSGTWDLLPGVTYRGQMDHWSWGAQTLLTLRPGRNNIGYSLGNEYEMTFWGAREWSRWFSQSVGLRYKIWENIGGRDPSLNPLMVPTADPKSRGGKRLDFLFGVSFNIPKGFLKGQRAAIDFGVPVMQSLDGPQLETDWYFTAGWQASFG